MGKKAQFRLLGAVDAMVKSAKKARAALSVVHGKGVDIDVRELKGAMGGTLAYLRAVEDLVEEMGL